MVVTLKNKKIKKIKNTIKNNRNLRGGKNFIDILFNINDNDTKASCQKKYKSENETSNKYSKEQQIIQNQIVSSNNILEEWIKHTDENGGMTLYFVTENIENKNQEENNNAKWLSGFHGKALNNEYKINFNEYLKKKLESSEDDLFQNCLHGDDKNTNRDCQESLNMIQTTDINDITSRVNMNNKVNEFLFKWLQSQNSIVAEKEKEIQQKIEEMQTKLKEKKQEIDSHKNNIKSLISKNINYNKIIKEYISSNPDYEKLKNTDVSTFEIPEDLIKYVSIALENKDNKDLNENFHF